MSASVLIVGGAGYIGSHVNKILSNRGVETVVLDNLVYGHQEFARWGTFVKGDVGDRQELHQLFANHAIDAVMHFSAYAYVGESVEAPLKYYRNNVANTINLMEVMREYGIQHFVFSSTCATYGDPLRIPIDESHPQVPISPYGKTKLMVEQMLRDADAAYGLRSVSLRYFNAAGADPDGDIGEWHDPETHLIPLILDAALGRRPEINIFGTDYETPDGTCIRDYIHVHDLAEAHVLALDYLRAGGVTEVFNLGNGHGFSVREVIEEAKRLTGQAIPVTEVGRRAGDPAVLVGSADKIRSVLGWSPRYPGLSEIIGTAWNWHQKLFSVR